MGLWWSQIHDVTALVVLVDAWDVVVMKMQEYIHCNHRQLNSFRHCDNFDEVGGCFQQKTSLSHHNVEIPKIWCFT